MKTPRTNVGMVKLCRPSFLMKSAAVGLFLMGLAHLAGAVPALPVIPAGTFVITNYGAVGDGITTNTLAISNAVAAAGAAGGGTVEVPAGTFLSGPFILTNSINLQLDSGATLELLPFGSYPSTIVTNTTNYAGFISGTNLHDVEISGTGTVEGQGSPWWTAAKANSKLQRPDIIDLAGCQRALIQNVGLQNSPGNNISFTTNGGNITIQSMSISNPGSATNAAGIELTGTNCLVQNCSIANASDDCIQIQAEDGVAADILITNCAFGIGHGLSIGSQTEFGVSNMTVINCTFNGTYNGFRLKSDRDRGGVVQDINYYSNSMINVQMPVIIYSYYDSVGKPSSVTPAMAAANTAFPLTNTTPTWRDITISNLTATTQSGYPAGIIWGRPELAISNVTLIDLNISCGQPFDVYNAQNITFINSTFTLDGSKIDYLLFDAGIVVTDSAPNSVTMDGLATATTNNLISLNNESASLTTNVIGNSPTLSLDGSTIDVNDVNLALSSNAVENFYLGAAPSEIEVDGNLLLSGTLNFTNTAGFTNGSYTLFTYINGSLTTNYLTIGSMPIGCTGIISTNTPGQVNLVVSKTPPHIGAAGTVGGGGSNVVFSGGVGAPGSIYYVLASTNVALPLSNWTVLATNQFNYGGSFSFTNVINPGVPRQFYRLQVP
jgi:polygalacturonase